MGSSKLLGIDELLDVMAESLVLILFVAVEGE